MLRSLKFVRYFLLNGVLF